VSEEAEEGLGVGVRWRQSRRRELIHRRRKVNEVQNCVCRGRDRRGVVQIPAACAVEIAVLYLAGTDTHAYLPSYLVPTRARIVCIMMQCYS